MQQKLDSAISNTLLVKARTYLRHHQGFPKPFTGDFTKAAKLFSKVCGQDTKRWEDWLFVFAQKQQLQVSTQAVVRAKVAHSRCLRRSSPISQQTSRDSVIS